MYFHTANMVASRVTFKTTFVGIDRHLWFIYSLQETRKTNFHCLNTTFEAGHVSNDRYSVGVLLMSNRW